MLRKLSWLHSAILPCVRYTSKTKPCKSKSSILSDYFEWNGGWVELWAELSLQKEVSKLVGYTSDRDLTNSFPLCQIFSVGRIIHLSTLFSS